MECNCWRKLSKDIPKNQPAPDTVEHLQAAWERDQELIFEMRDEITRLKVKLNQARQNKSPAGGGANNTGTTS